MSAWHPPSSAPPSIPDGVVPTSVASNSMYKPRPRSGLTYTWRLWRHCCCRYGWYPLTIAPLVTAGCFLSLYSSAGCDFVRVNVGFTPSNTGWNQSTAQLGLFLYQSGESEINQYREFFVDGCRWYDEEFSNEFIDNDRTWLVSRIMSYISGGAGIAAMITAWLFVISPLPASFFWPGVLLPTLMAAFLAEGSKFLVFDATLCRNTVWFPSGTNSSPQVAEDCVLGSTSFLVVASGAIFFLCVLLVCLKAPEKRILESDYGTRTDLDIGESDLENAQRGSRVVPRYDEEDRMYNQDPDFDLSLKTGSLDDKSATGSRHLSQDDSDHRYDPVEYGESLSAQFSGEFQNEELVYERMKNLDGDQSFQKEDADNDSYDDRYNPKKPAPAPSDQDDEHSVSESRLHAAERLKLSTNTESNELIDNFVNEVNNSFVDAQQPQEVEASKSAEKENEIPKSLEETEPKQTDDDVAIETSTLCGASLCTETKSS